MKKSLFFYAAATALMLTACSSEDDILQTGQTKKVAPQEVGFDVYTQAANDVTRAGLQGTMTTSRLQRIEAKGGGFGVYAFQVQDQVVAAGYGANATAYGGRTTPVVPNFMVNEKLLWNSTNQGWYYNPLKYWPNETDNDSQDTQAEMEAIGGNKHLDRLTFFAYAPYVNEGVKEFGITGVTANNGKLTPKGKLDAPTTDNSTARDLAEPSVSYYASLADPNKSVDLLWGVAPSGGLSYTAVNGNTVTVPEGQPLIDMTKPDVNTAMKFLFQHALARINVKAVAAIDQVAPGGKLDPNTKITIDNISLKGYFGETGVLNLDNDHVNIANWVNINGEELSAHTGLTGLTQKTITIGHDRIAEHLRFRNTAHDGGTDPDPRPQTDRVGVTTVLQNVLEPNNMTENPDWFTSKDYAAGELAYSETTPYYSDPACTTLATAKIAKNTAVTKNSDGSYTEVVKDVTLSYPMELKYYEISDWYEITAADVKAKTYDAYTAYNDNNDNYAPTGKKPIKGNKILKSGMRFVKITALNQAAYAGKQGYTYNSKSKTYSPKKVGEVLNAGDYVLIGEEQKCAPAFEWTGGTKKAFYKRDANYFMVVPTNNISIVRNLSAEDEVKLRKVRVKIEYYITTEDSKLDAGRAQTKNVIEKNVIFPSIANGKSYNLNLILGLTSVKMEAEVDDWKVVNVQGDLPQNTATE